MGVGDGIPYGSWGDESYGHENEIYDDNDYDDASEEDYGSDVEVDDDEAEDAFDVHARGEGVEGDNQIVESDPSLFSSDEAYARALQDAEEREMAARMLALSGINESRSRVHCSVLYFINYHFYLLSLFWWSVVVVGEDEDVDEDEEEHAGINPVLLPCLYFYLVFVWLCIHVIACEWKINNSIDLEII